MKLGVVVPAYNEEPRLARSLERIRDFLSSQDYEWEVTIVDDGSADSTAAIASAFAEADSHFKMISYAKNKGKGYAVRTGMIRAEADWLLLCDADLAAPIEEVIKLFAAGRPIAIGSRPLRESSLEVRQPWWREASGRAFNFAVQALSLRGIKDTQCGFKLFSREAAKEVFPRCRFNGFSYDFESLMVARKLGFEIAEVPIRWSHQAGSKVRLVRDGLHMLRDLVALRLTLASRLK
ncbi:MAG: glycosyltransferase family 2 protein [Armatimonadota bacterium]|nr:glycosyltransferase family 2 protein [Armatimonadota bacterium]